MITKTDVFKGILYRLRVDFAHEGADALQLPAPGPVSFYFPGLNNGPAQIIINIDAGARRLGLSLRQVSQHSTEDGFDEPSAEPSTPIDMA